MGSVYFAGESITQGPIKIGYSGGDPLRRVRELQAGNPRPLVLIHATEGSQALELATHRLCAPYRLTGEWFERSGCVLEVLEMAKAGDLSRLLKPTPTYIPDEIELNPEASVLYKRLLQLVPGLRAEVVEIRPRIRLLNK